MSNEPQQPDMADAGHWEALARYVTGESPPAEAAGIRRWLDAEPGREARLSALARTTQGLAFRTPSDLDVDSALARVMTRMAEDDVRRIESAPARVDVSATGEASSERGGSGWRTIGWRAAAAIVALLGGVLVWQMVRSDTGPDVASARTWETAAGQTETVGLPDGTMVLLGPLSRLVTTPGYGEDGRQVEFYGEARFDVIHDDDRPFTVRTGAAEVVDLGTTFTVRSMEAEEVRVAVTAGSVILRALSAAADSGVVLRAGDRGVLDRAGRVVAQPDSAGDADLAWTEGRLVFHDSPLRRVATELRRWYGIQLTMQDSALAQRPLTSTFEGETIDEVLRVIELATDTRTERQGDTVFVRPAPAGVLR